VSESILDALLAVARVDDVLRLARVEVPGNEKAALRCPLHRESSPSFHRQKSGRGFKCFGCGAHGGVLDLVVALQLAPNRKGAVDMLVGLYGLAKGLSGNSVQAPHVPKMFSLEVRTDAPLPTLSAEERRSLAEAVRACQPLLS
jgi:DNA primase